MSDITFEYVTGPGDSITFELTGMVTLPPGGGGGTSDHRDLTNRSSADQHPTSAITGLDAALAGKETAGAAVPKSLVDAKGDLIVATADNTPARVAVGSNGMTPVANSNETAGIGWYAQRSDIFFASGVIVATGPFISSSVVMVNNRMYLWPFHIPVRTTFDRIGVNHLSGVSTTGVIRVALYTSATVAGIPSALLTDFSGATLDPTTAAAIKLLTISTTLDPGTYWAAVVWQGTGTSPNIGSAVPSGSFIYPDATGAGNTVPITTGVSGSPPNPAAPNSGVNAAPVVYVRPA